MAFSPITFGREAFDELKKVTWPSRAEVTRLSIAVIVISLLVGVFLSGIDLFIEKLIGGILGR